MNECVKYPRAYTWDFYPLQDNSYSISEQFHLLDLRPEILGGNFKILSNSINLHRNNFEKTQAFSKNIKITPQKVISV